MQFTQIFDGFAAARGGSLGLAVTKDGSVLSYTGETVRGSGLSGSFRLSPASALKGVAAKVAGVSAFTATKTGTKAGYDVFAKGPFAASSYVKKVAFPTSDGARAAYSVLFIEKLDEAYQVVVDAETGKQLHKSQPGADTTAGGTVYDNYPGAPAGGQPRHVSFDKNDASPKGYVDPTGVLGTGITTFGNNANAHANWSNYIAPVDQGPRPISPTGQFDYPFADHWGTSKCDPTSYPQGPGAGEHEPLLPAQPDPRRVLPPRLHRVRPATSSSTTSARRATRATRSRASCRPAPSPAATRRTPAATTPTC